MTAMVISKHIIDDLSEQTKVSPRVRMHFDLRNSSNDNTKRMLNAIEPGSIMQIHRHQKTSETVICLRGKVVEEFFDELERISTDSIVLSPNGPNVAINVPIGKWHRLRAVESGSVVLSVKDGKCEPLSDVDILAL